jgi:pimeloyl-ACP methyl ester carboxylesterase
VPGFRLRAVVVAVLLIAVLPPLLGGRSGPPPARAADGDILRTLTAQNYTCPIGTGIAFNGTALILSCDSDTKLTYIDPANGQSLGTTTVTGMTAIGAMAFDRERHRLWACGGFNDPGVYLIDPVDGSSTFQFSTPGCVDGLAYDGIDDTIWVSPDVSSWIYHYRTNGTLIETIPFNVACGNSGLAIGGPYLFMSNDGCSQIWRARRDAPASPTLFGSFPQRLEDMECDDITFRGQGKAVIWSKDAYDGILNAFELNPDDCGYGGLPTQRNLILVPGIMGSVLAKSGNEIWPNAQGMLLPHDDLSKLKLATNGVDEDDGVPADVWDITRSISVTIGGFPLEKTITFHHYDTTIDELAKHGYRENVNLFVFPYDWRKTNDENARLLVQFMKAHRSCPTCKVDVLAHSQGGLVTLAALNRIDAQNLVDHVVTAGTPVLGAPKALGVVGFNTPCLLEASGRFISWAHICLLEPNAVGSAVQNMPGVYELLPGFAYADSHSPGNPSGSPLYFDHVKVGDAVLNGPQTYDQWTQYFRDHHNAGVLGTAQSFRRQDDPRYAPALVDRLNKQIEDWAPPLGVELARIVGFGVSNTPEQVIVYNKRSCAGGGRGAPPVCTTRLDTHWLRSTQGDGTVPVNSADLFRSNPCFDRRNGIHDVYFDLAHEDLVRDSDAVDWAVRYLLQGDSMFSSAPASCTAGPVGAKAAAAEQTAAPASGVGPFDEPFPTDGYAVVTTGSVDGQITDGAGDMTGRLAAPDNAVATTDVPGSGYDEIGSEKTYSFDETAQATGRFTIAAQDGADLRVRRTIADAPAAQAYWDLGDLPVGSIVTLAFSTDADPAALTLQIDADGDGHADETRPPTSTTTGDGASDLIAPVTTASVAPSGGGSAVTLTATDEGGSGVAATYFSVGSDAFGRYTGAPILAGPGAKVTFYSVDNAGNAEQDESVTTPAGFAFQGFFQPIDNQPTLNVTKAGSAVPVKFSLGGDFGLGIFAAGYPKSESIDCANGVATDDVEQTVNAGGSSLAYDSATGTYTYVWKTSTSWAKSCRRLTLTLTDGTTKAADFKFK